MVTFSIVIKMTGLLLLAPNARDGSLPLHVLMPVPHSSHVAQIGFRVPRDQCADDYDGDFGVCYVDMTDYYMSIGEAGSSRNPVVLDEHMANITDVLGHTIDRGLFGNAPGSNLRSRISLSSGELLTSPCGLGIWYFGTGIRLPVRLNNVVGWRIPDAGTDSLVLMRRKFGADTTSQKLRVLFPNASHEIELFIRQVPPGAKRLNVVPMNAALEFDARMIAEVAAISPPGTVARHFDAFYDLLTLNGSQAKPRPVLILPIKSSCEFVRLPTFNISGRLEPRSPGTAACMVASALPPD